MTLGAGERLGSYEIAGRLGAGGMGEVYRARDTRLERNVALKLLPESFTRDPDRLARFRREAQVLASLNHPNIAAIYGIEESAHLQVLVLELVDGETLAERLARGPLPLEDALQIAAQLADALEAAHDKGIVHRDLKPANIGLTRDGMVKVLDFGLAKTTDDESVQSAATSPGTAIGVVVGTAAYMSPEQARGQAIDRRCDIWAFGCVLYEMVVGQAAFGRATLSDTIASVLTAEPDWTQVPSRIAPLLRNCLQRDPKRRLRDVGDFRFLLEAPGAPRDRSSSRYPYAWIGATLVLAAALVAALARPGRSVQNQPEMRLDVNLGTAPPGALTDVAISPDGSRLVFRVRDSEGRPLLATRLLSESKTTRLTGTEGADQPFFSSDGQWIGFYSGFNLAKIPVYGGAAIVLCAAGTPRGASWSDDGSIIAAVSNDTGLARVPAGGGTPVPVTTTSLQDPTHRWPQVLPGGKAVIFTANTPTLNSYEDATIDVVTLGTGERRTLWRGGYFGRYLPTGPSRGHLAFVHNGTLLAVPFDPERLEIQGTPVPILEDLAADPGNGAGHFDFSRTGTFVFDRGLGLRPWVVSWVDPEGKPAPLLSKPALYFSPRFSPDGRKLAIGVDGGKGADIFVYDLQQQAAVQRLTFTSAQSADPVWASDGKSIVFRSGVGKKASIWWVRADGSASPVQLAVADAGDLGPNSLTHDGRTLVFGTQKGAARAQLFTLAIDTTDADHPIAGPPSPLFPSAANMQRPALSPDDRWLAYSSDESGRSEIYVLAFSRGPSGRWQVSSDGGGFPVWSADRKSIFYLQDHRIMVAQYSVDGNTFRVSSSRPWSSARVPSWPGYTAFDMAPDGRRAAILSADGRSGDEPPQISMITNFFETVRRLAVR
jgi:Tol biopolymer transport system component